MQQGEHRTGLRLEVVGIGFEQHHALFARGRKHGVSLRPAQTQRLFAQNMLAAQHRLDRPLGVQVVGQRNVDCLDGFVVEQRFVAAVVPRNAAIAGKRFRDFHAAAGDGGHVHRVRGFYRSGELASDVGGAEDADGEGMFLRASTGLKPDSIREG